MKSMTACWLRGSAINRWACSSTMAATDDDPAATASAAAISVASGALPVSRYEMLDATS